MPIEEATPAPLTVPELRDVYTRLAPLYGFWAHWAEGKARRLALDLASVRNGDSVLEVGVGTGSAFRELAAKNPRGLTVGVDLTPAMLRRTAGSFRGSSLPVPPLCQCDSRFLPFGDGAFDLVYSAYMLDALSVGDIETALGEMQRVLKPSGRLVLINLSLRNRWFNGLWGALCWVIPNLLGGCRPIRIVSHLAVLGLTVLEHRHITEGGVPSEVILARKEG